MKIGEHSYKKLWEVFVDGLIANKALFVVFVLFEVPSTLEYNVIPKFLGRIVDGLIQHSEQRESIFLFVGEYVKLYVALWVVLHVCLRIAGLARAFFLPKFSAHIRMAILEHVIYQNSKYFIDNLSGDINSRISVLSEKLTSLLDNVIVVLIPFCVTIPTALCLIAKVKVEIAFIVAFWFLIHMIACAFLGKKCLDYEGRHVKELSALVGSILDTILNINVVRLFCNEKFELGIIKKAQEKEQLAYRRSLVFSEILKGTLAISTIFIGIIGVFFTGYYYWIKGYISVGDFIFIINSSVSIISLSWYIGLQFTSIFMNLGSCLEASSTLCRSCKVANYLLLEKLKITQGKIEFKNVRFKYGEKDLFENVSLTIKPGEKVGIVGYSGAGKSTFCNLITEPNQIAAGQILIDNQDINGVTQNSLLEMISVVPQDISLFHRTIFENISYGKINASAEEVFEAARKAGADMVAEGLSEKYETNVGECGGKLSKGQIQKVMIARAFLKNSRIMILDEATSALDPVSERLIQSAINNTSGNKTIIVITHKLSSLKKMNRIVVFEKGKIVETGTYEELMLKKGAYFNMLQLQANN